MQTVYPLARNKFLKGQIDWEGDNFFGVAVDATYTYSAAHEFRDDLTGVLGYASLAGMAAVGDGWADACWLRRDGRPHLVRELPRRHDADQPRRGRLGLHDVLVREHAWSHLPARVLTAHV